MVGKLRLPALVLPFALLCAAPAQDRVIGRPAQIREFPQLPASVAQDLIKHGCRIPQVEGLSQPHNAIQGAFKRRGQRDWAVLCLRRNTSKILVYWNGSASKPAELAPMDETINPSKDGYYRILRVVGAEFVRRHYAPDMSPKPPAVIDHDAIDDGIFEKGSRVHYFHNGDWIQLTGSD
jgi:hypothetical protein